MDIEIGPNLSGVLVGALTVSGPIVAALAAYYARRAARKASATHDLVNSRMTELLELTRRSARAEGLLEATGTTTVPDVSLEVTMLPPIEEQT